MYEHRIRLTEIFTTIDFYYRLIRDNAPEFFSQAKQVTPIDVNLSLGLESHIPNVKSRFTSHPNFTLILEVKSKIEELGEVPFFYPSETLYRYLTDLITYVQDDFIEIKKREVIDALRDKNEKDTIFYLKKEKAMFIESEYPKRVYDIYMDYIEDVLLSYQGETKTSRPKGEINEFIPKDKTYIERIRSLIIEDKLELAMNELDSILEDKENQKNLLLLRNRYIRLRKVEREGTSSISEMNLENNRIVKGLIELLYE